MPLTASGRMRPPGPRPPASPRPPPGSCGGPLAATSSHSGIDQSTCRPSRKPKPFPARSSASAGGRSFGSAPATMSISTRRTAAGSRPSSVSGDRHPGKKRTSTVAGRTPASSRPSRSAAASGTLDGGSATGRATSSAHPDGPISAPSATTRISPKRSSAASSPRRSAALRTARSRTLLRPAARRSCTRSSNSEPSSSAKASRRRSASGPGAAPSLGRERARAGSAPSAFRAAAPRSRWLRSRHAQRFSCVSGRPVSHRRKAARSASWTNTRTPAAANSVATALFTAATVPRSVSPGRNVSRVSTSG